MKWLNKNWAPVMAVLIFLYLLVALDHANEFHGLRGRVIKDSRYRRPSDLFSQPGTEDRVIELDHGDEKQLEALLTRQFSKRNGWNTPFIERGNCFTFQAFKGALGQMNNSDDTVEVAGHLVNGNFKVWIFRRRPLSRLENGIAAMSETFAH